MKVSVVMATYNRRHLLWRSLECYARQNMDAGDFELIVLDDWSSDGTDALLQEWAQRLNIIAIRPPYKTPGTWRSEASILNIGLRASQGQLVIATHPEILPGKNSLVHLWDHREEKTYHCCKCFFLTPENQTLIDTVDWKADPWNITTLPGFWNDDSPVITGSSDYTHNATMRHKTWESWMFGGGKRSFWSIFGGFYPFKTWGSIDVWFWETRKHYKIPNKTELDPTTVVYHQNHDTDGTTYRDMAACLAALKGIPYQANELW